MPAGRPTKCTPHLTKKVCAIILEGNYAVIAAQVVDISEKTYYEWLRRGAAEPGTVYAKFRQSIKKAEANAERNMLARAATAATSEGHQWQAFMTIMERRWRARWARQLKAAPEVHVYTEHKPDDWQRDCLGVEHDQHEGPPSCTIEMPEAAEETKP